MAVGSMMLGLCQVERLVLHCRQITFPGSEYYNNEQRLSEQKTRPLGPLQQKDR